LLAPREYFTSTDRVFKQRGISGVLEMPMGLPDIATSLLGYIGPETEWARWRMAKRASLMLGPFVGATVPFP
jgi:hypothetical protein